MDRSSCSMWRSSGSCTGWRRRGRSKNGWGLPLCAGGSSSFCRSMALNFSFHFPTNQHLKKSKETEEDMLYGTIVRTPTKRRFLGTTTTPNKSRKVSKLRVCVCVCEMYRPLLWAALTPPCLYQFNATSSSSSTTSNSTMRCAFGGTVCRSPVLRLPLSANKVGFMYAFGLRRAWAQHSATDFMLEQKNSHTI